MAFFRRSRLVTRRADGTFQVALDGDTRDIVRVLLTDLDRILTDEPDHPNLERLHPPAYLEDADRDQEYQLLAGEELRSSRRAAIAVVIDGIDRTDLTEDDLWGWLQALNALRLVVGTRLGIDDEGHDLDPADATDPSERSMWAVYGLASVLQQEIVEALSPRS